MAEEEKPNEAPILTEYTEDHIRHLSDMEHIRTRPGMYIGKLGDGSHAEDGIYVLLPGRCTAARRRPAPC